MIAIVGIVTSLLLLIGLSYRNHSLIVIAVQRLVRRCYCRHLRPIS